MAEHSDFAIDLSSICVDAQSIDASLPCAAVYEIFASDVALPAIAVVGDAGTPVGIVHRHDFMLRLADVFGRPLYEKQSIEQLMDAAPVCVERLTSVSALTTTPMLDGRWDAQANFIIVDGGRYLGIGSSAGLLRTITDRLRDQTAVAEAARKVADQAADARSRFLANITHELRTPLNGVIGFGQLLEQEAHGPLGASEYKLYAKDIVESGEHLVAIINDILDLAKIEAGHIDLRENYVDLRALIGRSFRMVATLARQKGVELMHPAPGAQWTVHVDERRLQQAIVNLLSNAIKFTAPGASVGVDLGVDDRSTTIDVWDEGCGIDADDLKRLFKPFGQGRNATSGGTGLGLTITRALMQAHDGDVSLSSEVGVGTRARLVLPIARLLPDEFAWSAYDEVEFLDAPTPAKAS